MARLFVSYAHEDRPFVVSLAAALEARDHDVWWDRELSAGGEFRNQIQAALDAADLVLVVWSARSRLSRFVADEADLALAKGKLIPVMIDGARPPLGFGAIQAIDLSSWSGAPDDATFLELYRVVVEKLAEGPVAPPQRPLLRVTRATIVLTVAGALAFGFIQAGAQALRVFVSDAEVSLGELARFGFEHIGVALLLVAPVAFFASMRARRLGLSRLRAAVRPFLQMLFIGWFIALVLGALAFAGGVSSDLAPAERAAELASIVALAALVVAAALSILRLVLARTRRPAG